MSDMPDNFVGAKITSMIDFNNTEFLDNRAECRFASIFFLNSEGFSGSALVLPLMWITCLLNCPAQGFWGFHLMGVRV